MLRSAIAAAAPGPCRQRQRPPHPTAAARRPPLTRTRAGLWRARAGSSNGSGQQTAAEQAAGKASEHASEGGSSTAAADAGSDGEDESGGGWRRRRLTPLPPVLGSMDEDASEVVTSNGSGDALPAFLLDHDDYKEESRRYFRTVFDHDRWAAHRSTRRYLRHALGIWQSRMIRGLAAPLTYIAALSTSIAVYHTCAEAGLVPQVPLDLQIRNTDPFSLSAFALSLLLGQRTNASYSRWLDARKAWGTLVNRGRDLVRQAITYIPPEEEALLELVCRWTVAYSRATMCHLRCDVDAAAELRRVLPPEEAEAALAAQNRPAFCLQVLSQAIKEAQEPPALAPASAGTALMSTAAASAGGGGGGSSNGSGGAAPHPAAQHAPLLNPGVGQLMDTNLTAFADVLGSCERILRTPIPLSYTRHTSRFMMIWLTMLPFALWDSCRWATVPLTVVIAFLLMGIEEIGVAIEEPFSILPLEQLCDVLERTVWELHGMHVAAAAGGSGARNTAEDIVRQARRRRPARA